MQHFILHDETFFFKIFNMRTALSSINKNFLILFIIIMLCNINLQLVEIIEMIS